MSRPKLTPFGEAVVEEMRRCPYAITVQEAKRRVKERRKKYRELTTAYRIMKQDKED